jgi:glutamyl-tRNA reductase
VSQDEITRVAVVGANHRSSSINLRDRLFVTEAMMPEVVQMLRQADLKHFLLMSTCDRVEVQLAHRAPEIGAASVRDVFSALAKVDPGEIEESTYLLTDERAARHMFAVGASLDSQIIGEPQVLGQMKESYRQADEDGRINEMLRRTLQHGFRVAKRVRTETEIARGVVSIASAAVSVARNLHGDMGDKEALVFGLGEMGELVSEQLGAAGLKSFGLTAYAGRTEAVARQRGYRFEPYEALDVALARADILICATGSGRIEIQYEQLEAALLARRHRPILVIDTGIPAEVDVRVEALDDIYLYSLDDLEQVAMRGRTHRQEGSDQAWAIVDEEVGKWQSCELERDVAPAITDLHTHCEAIRLDILTEAPEISAEEATRRLVNRLLHGPIETMRRKVSASPQEHEKAVAEIEKAIATLFYQHDIEKGE